MFFRFNFLLYSANLIIHAVKKLKVKIAVVIPTGAPITVVNKIIDTPPLVAEQTIKVLSM